MVIAIYDNYASYIRVNKKTTLWFGKGRKDGCTVALCGLMY